MIVFYEDTNTTVLSSRMRPTTLNGGDLDFQKWRKKEEEILRDIEPITSLTNEILHLDRFISVATTFIKKYLKYLSPKGSLQKEKKKKTKQNNKGLYADPALSQGRRGTCPGPPLAQGPLPIYVAIC